MVIEEQCHPHLGLSPGHEDAPAIGSIGVIERRKVFRRALMTIPLVIGGCCVTRYDRFEKEEEEKKKKEEEIEGGRRRSLKVKRCLGRLGLDGESGSSSSSSSSGLDDDGDSNSNSDDDNDDDDDDDDDDGGGGDVAGDASDGVWLLVLCYASK
ncbi:hypothetical protein M0804_006372 [Polistes exclamans]|nr:hypothetical protein M0804_006372 [Polistes exclamans]